MKPSDQMNHQELVAYLERKIRGYDRAVIEFCEQRRDLTGYIAAAQGQLNFYQDWLDRVEAQHG